MAVYPNNYHSAIGWNPYRYQTAQMQLIKYRGMGGNRLNVFLGEAQTISKTASAPDGYDMKGLVKPLTAGSVSSYQPTSITFTQSGVTVSVKLLDGSTTLVLSESGSLSMVVTSEGTFTFDWSQLADLAVSLTASGSFSADIQGSAQLNVVVPSSGSFAFVLSQDGDLKGLLSMTGEWTPFTELSPQSLATAVWAASAVDNNDVGSMGEKLNDAGSGGDPWATDLDSYTTPGTAGNIVKDKLLKKSTFIALK